MQFLKDDDHIFETHSTSKATSFYLCNGTHRMGKLCKQKEKKLLLSPPFFAKRYYVIRLGRDATKDESMTKMFVIVVVISKKNNI